MKFCLIFGKFLKITTNVYDPLLNIFKDEDNNNKNNNNNITNETQTFFSRYYTSLSIY